MSMETTMKHAPLAILIMTATLSLTTAAAFAQTEKTDLGKKQYDLQCAICHGADANGQWCFWC